MVSIIGTGMLLMIMVIGIAVYVSESRASVKFDKASKEIDDKLNDFIKRHGLDVKTEDEL